ncbi:KAP family NTPase [Escherichia coli]|nr:KAP family NTPase [Escherichia coli]
MTQTLNPVITVTVSGPVGSGKSYVLARIEEVVKQEFGDSVIVDAADVDDERRMSGDDLTHMAETTGWHSDQAGGIHGTGPVVIRRGAYLSDE